MAAYATYNPALQRQKFTDKLKGLRVSILYKMLLGSSKVHWENVVYKMNGVCHPIASGDDQDGE